MTTETLTARIYKKSNLTDCLQVVVDSFHHKRDARIAFQNWKDAPEDDVWKVRQKMIDEIGETLFAICCDASKNRH